MFSHIQSKGIGHWANTLLVSPTPRRVEAVLQQVKVQPCSQAIGYVDISDISGAIGPLLLAAIPFGPMASI